MFGAATQPRYMKVSLNGTLTTVTDADVFQQVSFNNSHATSTGASAFSTATNLIQSIHVPANPISATHDVYSVIEESPTDVLTQFSTVAAAQHSHVVP